MQTTNEFLDSVKAKHGLTSDYQLSKLMQCTHSVISGYRHGRSKMDEETACKVAELLDLQPGYVMACIAAERAKSPRVRKAWENIASMAVAASVVGIVAGLALILSGGAMSLEGLSYGALAVTSDLSGLYIMRNLDVLSVLNWALFAAFLVALLLSLRDYHLTKKTHRRQEAHHPEV